MFRTGKVPVRSRKGPVRKSSGAAFPPRTGHLDVRRSIVGCSMFALARPSPVRQNRAERLRKILSNTTSLGTDPATQGSCWLAARETDFNQGDELQGHENQP